MSFAETGSAVNEERIGSYSGRFSNSKSRCVSEAVGRSHYKIIKGIFRIEKFFGDKGIFRVFASFFSWFFLRIIHIIHRVIHRRSALNYYSVFIAHDFPECVLKKIDISAVDYVSKKIKIHGRIHVHVYYVQLIVYFFYFKRIQKPGLIAYRGNLILDKRQNCFPNFTVIIHQRSPYECVFNYSR